MAFTMDMGNTQQGTGGGGDGLGFYSSTADQSGGIPNPFDTPMSYGGNPGLGASDGQPQQQDSNFGGSFNSGDGSGGFDGGFQQQHFMQPGPPQDTGFGNAAGSMGSMDSFGGTGGTSGFGADGFDEPPLLEELGIDFYQIQQKTLSVLNPMRQTEPSFMAEADLAGPLVFCMLFGATMLASGRIEFGYIYGVSIVGCGGMYSILNLMSDHDISFAQVASILGYCLLPMVGLSALGIIFTLSTQLGGAISLLAISWCAFSASRMFSVGLSMHGQQALIAYPCMLLYGVFAMLAVF